jgi:hypothetical protein
MPKLSEEVEKIRTRVQYKEDVVKYVCCTRTPKTHRRSAVRCGAVLAMLGYRGREGCGFQRHRDIRLHPCPCPCPCHRRRAPTSRARFPAWTTHGTSRSSRRCVCVCVGLRVVQQYVFSEFIAMRPTVVKAACFRLLLASGNLRNAPLRRFALSSLVLTSCIM